MLTLKIIFVIVVACGQLCAPVHFGAQLIIIVGDMTHVFNLMHANIQMLI